MKNWFKTGSLFLAALFVAIVAFGSWYGGINSSKVEAGFAPLAVTEMVIDGTTANIVVGVVETTTIAENLAIGGIKNRQFNMFEFVATYIIGPLAAVNNEEHTLFDQPAGMTWVEYKSYIAYNRVCVSRSTISWTRRYLA